MPKPGEVLFTPEDTDAQLELVAFERTLCPGCRQNLEESTLPDSEGKYRTRRIACHSCVPKQQAERDLAMDPGAAGIYVIVERDD